MPASHQLINEAREELAAISIELRPYERIDRVMADVDAAELVRMLSEVRRFLTTPMPEEPPIPF